jgi:hypothetical protein
MSVVFNPGDKVKMTRGEEVLLGEVGQVTGVFGGTFWIRAADATRSVAEWERNGWSISVVPSTPTPEALPSEPGTFWVDRDGELWIVLGNGELVFRQNILVPNIDPADCTPFTQLGTRESWRASWAAEIADAIESKANSPILSTQLAASFIRSVFGGAVVDE